jgi:hypothetical protein
VISLAGPDVNISADQESFCLPGTTVLHAAVDPAYDYQWRKEGVDVPGASTSDYTVSQSGKYTIYIYDNNTACGKTSAIKTIKGYAPPVASITPLSALTFDDGGSVDLMAKPGTDATYEWTEGSGAALLGTQRYLTATYSGDFSVIVSRNGCSSTASITVTENDPAMRFAGTEASTAITIFPNPSEAIFNIQAAVAVHATVSDMSGRVILDQKNASFVDLSRFPVGAYLMQISDMDGKLLATVRLIRN